MAARSDGMPERIGRYEILLPIGSGGMATVYLARFEVVSGLYREVALKMMHPQLEAGGDAAWELIEEAKLTASIRHPNVVAVHEAAESPRGVYMIMDYVEGDTLSGLIRGARAAGERLPLPVAGRVLDGALAGLHAAHELTDAAGRPVNLVHRDYSPSNILVGVDGTVRLADFGVAKAESRASATASGAIKGKVGYMAPEQVLGKKLDRRADVWAAGVVAWECLAGRRLYLDDDQVATLFRIVQEEPLLLASERPDLPDELSAAVAAALTRDRDHRCPTAAELRARLAAAWRAIGPMAEPAEVGEYVKRVAGDRLRQRREQAAQVTELRRELASVSRAALVIASAGSPAARPLIPVPPAHAEAPDDDTATTDSIRRPPAPIDGATTREPAVAGAAPLGPAGALTTHPLPTLVAARPAAPPEAAPIPASAPGFAPAPSFAPAPPAGRRSPWTWALAVAVAAGAIGVGSRLAIRERTAGAQPAGTASASAAPETSGAVSAVASAPAPIASSAPSAPAPVIVRANAAIASLQVGARAIAMAQPAREVEIQISDAERTGALRIEAAAVDGRRAAARLTADATAVDLVFTGGARPAAPPPKRAPADPEPPRLAPSPFGNH